MRMGPVPGLEVAPESFQVHRREVSSDAFPQPPLALCCTGTAWLAELVPEMFSPNPPARKKSPKLRSHEVMIFIVSVHSSGLIILCLPTTVTHRKTLFLYSIYFPHIEVSKLVSLSSILRVSRKWRVQWVWWVRSSGDHVPIGLFCSEQKVRNLRKQYWNIDFFSSLFLW